MRKTNKCIFLEFLSFLRKNKGNHIQNKQFYNDTFFFNLDKNDESVVVGFTFA